LSRLFELRLRIGLVKSLKDLQDLLGEIRDAIINDDIPDDLLHNTIPDIHLEILRQAGKLQIEALTEVSNFVGQINSASYGLIHLKDTTGGKNSHRRQVI